MDQPDDSFYSSIEDLDPEPRPKDGLWRSRELAIGLALLLIVLGWGGWQWLHQQDVQANYRMAQDAAARRDWDTALARFSASTGYKDADARRADAAKQVAERNRLYSTAIAYMKKGDWAATLQATQSLQHIQPDYLDTYKVASNAESQVYQQAVQGAIAQRTGNQPGLFYRTANGWTRLPSSDAFSIARSYGIAGCAVYDVPSPDWTPRPTPTTTDPNDLYYNSWNGTLNQRQIMAFIQGGGKTTVKPLALSPLALEYVCAEHGVWALSVKFNWNFQESPSHYAAYDIMYQPFDSPVTHTLTMSGSDWLVMDLARNGSHVLLADFREPNHETFSRVYLADADGQNPRSIYAGAFYLDGARFSPDGSFAIAKTTRLVNPDTFERTLVLLDLKTRKPPTTISDLVFSSDEMPFPSIMTTFISDGFYEGDVLVLELSRAGIEARIVDPRSPARQVAGASFAYNPIEYAKLLDRDGTGDLTLVWQNSPAGGSPSTDNINILNIAPVSSGAPIKQPLGRAEYLGSVRTVGGYVSYSSWTTLPSNKGSAPQTYSVRSLPASRLDDPTTRASLVYTFTLDYPDLDYYRMFPINFGSGMLAYTDHGRLHARTYDGKIDLPLETGVTNFFYNPDSFKQDWLW